MCVYLVLAGVDAAWEQLLLEEQQHQERLISSSTASSSSSRGSHSSSPTAVLPPELLRNLAQVFSRGQDDTFNGLTPGFLEGSKHQRLVRGRAPRHRGLCLGRISAVTDRGVIIEGLLNPVKRGDGLVFDQGTPELEEEGGAVWDIFAAGGGSKGDGSSSKSRRGGRSSSGRKIDGEAPEGSAVELVFGPGQVGLGCAVRLLACVPYLTVLLACFAQTEYAVAASALLQAGAVPTSSSDQPLDKTTPAPMHARCRWYAAAA